MGKSIIICILLILVIVVTLGCINSNNTDVLNNLGYKNTEYAQKFGFDPPAGWTIDENDEYNLVRFIGPTIDDFKINLGLGEPGTLKSGATLESLAQNIIDNYPSIIPTFALISKTNIELNGMNAIEIIYTFQLDDFNMEGRQTLIESNNVIYYFTYTATTDSFDDYKDVIDNCLNTFATV